MTTEETATRKDKSLESQLNDILQYVREARDSSLRSNLEEILAYVKQTRMDYSSGSAEAYEPKEPRLVPSQQNMSRPLPVCNLIDFGNRYYLEVELPGIKKDKVHVDASKKTVEISAEASETKRAKIKSYVYRERLTRSFFRKIPIPDEIDSSKIKAKFEDGILSLDLPKANPVKAETYEEEKEIAVE
jgi:HSP20 family protein